MTHNWNERVGGFEHLSAEHDHEHDHSPLSHAHYPHENFEAEHQDEAHIHDHEQAVPARQSPGEARSSSAGTGRQRRP